MQAQRRNQPMPILSFLLCYVYSNIWHNPTVFFTVLLHMAASCEYGYFRWSCLTGLYLCVNFQYSTPFTVLLMLSVCTTLWRHFELY